VKRIIAILGEARPSPRRWWEAFRAALLCELRLFGQDGMRWRR